MRGALFTLMLAKLSLHSHFEMDHNASNEICVTVVLQRKEHTGVVSLAFCTRVLMQICKHVHACLAAFLGISDMKKSSSEADQSVKRA